MITDLRRENHAKAMRRSWSDPESRERRITALREARERGAAVKRGAVPVPKWVPRSLAAEYVEWGRMFDEDYAARMVRRLVANMRRR